MPHSTCLPAAPDLVSQPKVGVRLSVQKVISRATSTITVAAGSNGSLCLPLLASLYPAGPLPATALIITSYYLGGPIIDSWAVGKRATQLHKLPRTPLFQVEFYWSYIVPTRTATRKEKSDIFVRIGESYVQFTIKNRAGRSWKKFWSRSPSSIWSMWREALPVAASKLRRRHHSMMERDELLCHLMSPTNDNTSSDDRIWGRERERERDWKRAGRLLAFNVGRGRKINIFDCCYPDPPSLWPLSLRFSLGFD